MIACRSCDANWPMPARYLATPTLIDGSKGEEWPVCNEHMKWAMVAGWFPINEIAEGIEARRAETGNTDSAGTAKARCEASAQRK